MNVRSLKYLLTATTMLVLPAATASVFAAETAGSSDTDGIPEIVVTAQRQSQNVLAVPMSIQAISGEQLNESGQRDITSLQFSVPGFLPSAAVGFTQLFVRGVGNAVFGFADPSVTQYIDDVPRLYPSMVTQFVDVERVELLKGAQGGLYGRNATGGVLNIISRQPSTEKFSGNALVDYGEKNTFRAAAYVNIPISDKVAWSGAVERDSHDYYVKNLESPNPFTAAMFPSGSAQFGTPAQTAAAFNSNVNPPKGIGNQNLWAMDSKLLVKPSDNFKVTLAGDYARKKDSNGNQSYITTPAYLQGALQNIYFPFVAHIPVKFPANFIQGANGKYTTTSAITPASNLADYGVSLTPVLNLPGVDITSISAYRAQRSHGLIDDAPTTISTFLSNSGSHRWFYYQELRAASTNDGPFHVLGGATYLTSHISSTYLVPLLMPVSFGSPSIAVDKAQDWSIYVQASYDISHNLSLTASGRYIHETHSAEFVTAGGIVNLVETKFLPSATLSYKLDDGGNVYARYAKGFKAGGVNTFEPPSVFPTNQGLVFLPENVDTYEAGYRNALFDHKVNLTADVFYNKYSNLQTTAHAAPAYPAIQFAIVNAPSARTWGAEETFSWQVIKPLTLGVNAGYLNAKYINYQIVSTVLQTDNLSGTQMINAPKLQLSFTAVLDQPVTDTLRVVGNLLVSHTSSVLFQPTGLRGILPDAVGPAFWLTNLRLGVRTADDKYGFAVYANNLFNTQYFVYGSSAAAFGNLLSYGNPRIIGAEITAKF